MEWAYIAGFFDGEGHVNYGAVSRGNGTKRATGLSFYNTNAEVLNAIQAVIGGYISWRQSSGFDGRKPIGCLRVSKKVEIVHALQHMLQHLIVKRARAEQLLGYVQEHVDDTRMVNFGKVAEVSNEQLRQWNHEEGLGICDIARKLGVNPSAVSQAFSIRGIPTRRKSMKGIAKSEETRRRMRDAGLRRRKNKSTDGSINS